MNEWNFYLFSEYKSNAYKNENLNLYKGGSSPSKNMKYKTKWLKNIKSYGDKTGKTITEEIIFV